MATTIIRKPASFRLRADLLEGLKKNAARENRTLNNYVVEEVMSGKNPQKTYSDIDDMFNDILNEKE